MQDLLIVEDNRLFQRLVINSLTGFSGNHRLASDQEEAVQHLSATKPDMIISDLHMPVGTTETFLAQVSQLGLTKVLVMSSDQELLGRLKLIYQSLGWEFANKNSKFFMSKVREFVGVTDPLGLEDEQVKELRKS